MPLAGYGAVMRPNRCLRLAIEAKKGSNKGKAVSKSDLPTKVCATCGLSFTWRKKWEKCWDDVKYCSDRCRSKRGGGSQQSADDAVS